MGEAKRKRMAQAAVLNGVSGPPTNPIADQIDVSRVAASVRQVIEAITDFHGADCLLYAHIGAGLLSSLGMKEVKAVAGSAAWRVGSGDADVISHAREINGMQFTQTESHQAALFHAWIETPDLVIDLSISTLRTKAAQLDAADGGKTSVDWCPDFIWYSKSRRACVSSVEGGPTAKGDAVLRPRSVLMAPDAGVFNYTRHADIESFALPERGELEESLGTAVFAAQAAYAALGRGERINVIGVSEEGGLQEAPIENSLTQIDRHR